MHTWVLLHYKIPREPSSQRVFVWRKLRRLGAVLLHDAVWVLPATPRTREHFQWLAAEIVEGGGEALQWEGHLVMAGQEQWLVEQFLAQVDIVYDEILADLTREDADLAALARRYQQAQAADYFGSALGLRVRETLLQLGGGWEQ
jgi:ChrB-like protein